MNSSRLRAWGQASGPWEAEALASLQAEEADLSRNAPSDVATGQQVSGLGGAGNRGSAKARRKLPAENKRSWRERPGPRPGSLHGGGGHGELASRVLATGNCSQPTTPTLAWPLGPPVPKVGPPNTEGSPFHRGLLADLSPIGGVRGSGPCSAPVPCLCCFLSPVSSCGDPGHLSVPCKLNVTFCGKLRWPRN